VNEAWPDKLPMPAQFVVWAMRGLTPTERIVWYHHWFLDAGGADGCYASPKSMGPRCGTTERVIEETRGRLRGLGFLRRRDRPGTKQCGWRATIPPAGMMPRTLREASEKAVSMAAALDLHVAAMDAGPTLTPGSGPRSYRGSSPAVTGASAEGAATEGGRGEVPPSSSKANGQLLPAVEDVEEGQKQEGVFAHANKGRGGRATRVSDVLGDVVGRLSA
jgi:hypothetical protein